MRRLLSCVLLLVFGLPVVAPALGSEAVAESKLPACCRRNGAHHCMMSKDQIAALLHGDQFNEVRSKCPYCPSAPVSMHHEMPGLHEPAAVALTGDSQAARYRQIEAWARVALAGARHKRGPPQDSL